MNFWHMIQDGWTLQNTMLSEKHYANANKEQILYDFTYVRYLDRQIHRQEVE